MGSSSKSLTTLLWNLGNWRGGENWLVPSSIDFKQFYYKEQYPNTYPVGDCCMLTFFEYGLSTSAASFFDDDLAHNLEYNYSVNELLFYLTNDILLLKKKDADSHCPTLVTIEPSDMSKQEKRTFLTEDAKKLRADRRQVEQKERRAKGKAKVST